MNRVMVTKNRDGRERYPSSPPHSPEEKWELLEDEEETVDEPDEFDPTTTGFRGRRRLSQLLREIGADADENSIDYPRHSGRRMSSAEHSESTTSSGQESSFPVVYVRDSKRPLQWYERYAMTKCGRYGSRSGGQQSSAWTRTPPPQSVSDSSGGSSGKQRKVHFSHLHIRQYDRILGDNPSCSSGPSISIGWSYDKNNVLVTYVDDYERLRRRDRIPGKYCRDFKMTCDKREEILKSWGYTDDEIVKAVRKNTKARFQRSQTANNLAASKVEEFVEGLNKSLLKIVCVGKREKKILDDGGASGGKGIDLKKQKSQKQRRRNSLGSLSGRLIGGS